MSLSQCTDSLSVTTATLLTTGTSITNEHTHPLHQQDSISEI